MLSRLREPSTAQLGTTGMSLHGAVVRGWQGAAKRRWGEWSQESWARSAPGDEALHYAARAGDAATVEELIEGGADVERTNNHGVAPLDMAAAAGHAGVLSVLLRHGARLTYLMRALWLADEQGGASEGAARLLAGTAIPYGVGARALRAAMASGRDCATMALLEDGADSYISLTPTQGVPRHVPPFCFNMVPEMGDVSRLRRRRCGQCAPALLRDAVRALLDIGAVLRTRMRLNDTAAYWCVFRGPQDAEIPSDTTETVQVAWFRSPVFHGVVYYVFKLNQTPGSQTDLA